MRHETKLVFTEESVFEQIRAEQTNRRSTSSGLDGLSFDDFELRPLNNHDPLIGISYAYLDSDYPRLMDHGFEFEKTIWFNSKSELAPIAEPLHDAEVWDVIELKELGGQLHNPTVAQCEAWWEAWVLPENIQRHVRQVAWAAYVLAVLLRREGIRVDPILTHRGGLMHDLDKIKTLSNGSQHGKLGGDFLEQEGYPVLAEIVRGHNLDSIMKPGAEDRPWETNLVFFCDKLVEGDRLVSLDERFAALTKRYPGFMQRMAPSKDRVMAMNDRICEHLSLPSHKHFLMMLNDLWDQNH